MMFEEEFPSLKDREIYRQDTWTDAYFSDNAILECCLDKQRVREAIAFFFPECKVTDHVKEVTCPQCLLKQELKL